MATTTPTLAKLSRPRLFDALPRPRLFEILDDARRHPVVWIAAPPGAGKTTLVASWLEQRKLPGLWFQVDPGDADPATFFYYLGLAERALRGKRRTAMPVLTPEYLADLGGFARRFFRELFARLPADGVVVLDNFQEAEDSAAVHDVIVAAIDEVPAGMQVIVVSRAPVSAPYARLAANRALTVLDWEALKLTADETQALLASVHVSADAAMAAALHEQSGGWAAGLVLLAEHLRRGSEVGSAMASDSLQQVFAYFAGQLFDEAREADRRLLMQLSFLPAMSERLALELTGDEAATPLLDRLYRRHLFTDRRRGDETSYQFHALFRAFLQHRAATDLPPEQRAVIARRAGELLAAEGQPEVAMPLFLAAADMDAAEALILREASTLIGQGRWKVVVDWIAALPASRTERSQWLLHWLGAARIGVDPPAAREVLARAQAQALAAGDTHCQVQVAAGVVEALFLEYNRFTPIDPWIPVLETVLHDGFVPQTLEEELRAQSALLVALTYRMPEHPGIDRCVERVRALLRTGVNINIRVSAATHLCLYGTFTGHLEESRRATATLLPLLEDADVTIFRKTFAWTVVTWFCASSGEHALGRQAVEANEAIARNEGIHVAERFACILGFWLAMDRRDSADAADRIARFERIMIAEHPYEAASLANMQAWYGLFTNQPAIMLRHGPEAFRLYDDAGSIPHILGGLNGLVWACTEIGDDAGAKRWTDEHRRWSCRRNMEAYSHWVLDASAAIAALRRRDEPVAVENLRRLFAQDRGRFDGYGHSLSWARVWASTLAAAALQRGIETTHATNFIREYDLPPPSPDVEAWPWPVRIRALGALAIEVDGAPLVFAARVPRKPLALLRLLLAGDPDGVRDTVMMDTLWPDDDGDAARDAYRVALHRLRRLLGHADAIRSIDGRIVIDTRVCHVDVFALRARLDRGDLDTALRVYHGALLADDGEAAWLLGPRQRLEDRIVRATLDAATRREADGDVDGARDLCVRAFEGAPGASRLAEVLMRLQLETGAVNDALDTHRRHLDALGSGAGIRTSDVLRQLYEAALTTHAARSSTRQP